MMHQELARLFPLTPKITGQTDHNTKSSYPESLNSEQKQAALWDSLLGKGRTRASQSKPWPGAASTVKGSEKHLQILGTSSTVEPWMRGVD